MTKEELVQSLRQQSKGFQRASSQYRGVTRHQKGKWEARIGQASGKKYKCDSILAPSATQNVGILGGLSMGTHRCRSEYTNLKLGFRVNSLKIQQFILPASWLVILIQCVAGYNSNK